MSCIFLNQFKWGKKKGTKSGNLSGRSAWCNKCSYDVYWIHHKASQPAAGWRCTDIYSRNNRGGLNHRIPKAFRHCCMDLGFWAGKNLGFTFPIIFVACRSWGCWAWFLSLRDHAVQQCFPAPLCRDNAIMAGTISRLSPACLHRLFSCQSRAWAATQQLGKEELSSVRDLPPALRVLGQYPIVGNTAWLEICCIPLTIFNIQK